MYTATIAAGDVLAAAISNDSMGTVKVATVIIIGAAIVGVVSSKAGVKIAAWIVFGLFLAGTTFGVTIKEISGETVKTGTSTVDSVSK